MHNDNTRAAILAAVIEAMQPAEEMGGPEGADYLGLMRDIEAEARARVAGYCAAQCQAPTHPPAVGGYFVMIDHDTTADNCDTIEDARASGRTILAREPFACTVSIYGGNEGDTWLEDVGSSRGRGQFALPEAPATQSRG